MNEPEINPYASAETVDLSSSESLPTSGVSGSSIVWRIIFAVAIAGGVFGSGATFLGMLVAWISRTSSFSMTEAGGLMLGMMFSFLLGFTIASIPAVIVVPVCYLTYRSIRDSYRALDSRDVYTLSSICGAITGMTPVILLSGFGVGGWLLSLIPGVVGAVLTPLLMIRFARRIDQQLEWERKTETLENQPGNSPWSVTEEL